MTARCSSSPTTAASSTPSASTATSVCGRESDVIASVSLRASAVFGMSRRPGMDDDRLMDAATRRKLIDRYREGPAEVRAALLDADPVALDARPAPGEWSAREVVHHLADSETMSTIRLRRVL